MLPLTIYPDAEAVLIAYLQPLLVAYDPTFTIDVRGGDGHHVRVRRVGGVASTPAHDAPTIDVMVWHDTDASRMDAAQHLWGWVRASNNDTAGAGVVTYTGTVLGPRQMPDPADDTKTVCMFTVALLVRNA